MKDVTMKTPVPPPNPFEAAPAFDKLEIALDELAAAGSSVLKWIAREAGKGIVAREPR